MPVARTIEDAFRYVEQCGKRALYQRKSCSGEHPDAGKALSPFRQQSAVVSFIHLLRRCFDIMYLQNLIR